MVVRFANDDLDRLETDPDFNAGFDAGVVRRFRHRVEQFQDAAVLQLRRPRVPAGEAAVGQRSVGPGRPLFRCFGKD